MSLSDIQNRITKAEADAGRAAGSVKLIAVSKVQPDARVQSVMREGDTVSVTYLDAADQPVEERFDYVLAATGRRPNLGRLNLEALGLEVDRAGVPDYDWHTLQVCNLPIFLAGDVNNDRPLLHEATDEGKMCRL